MSILRVATAQYPLQKHLDLEAWKASVESWVKEATNQGARLLVFPEYGAMELVSIMPPSTQKDLQAQVREMNELRDLFVATYSQLSRKYQCSILAPSLPVLNPSGVPVNRAYFMSSHGDIHFQEKHHMTRFEDEQWGVTAGEPHLQVFVHEGVQIGVCICFDAEFPQAANILAKQGVKVLLVPSCTEGMAGCHRVHIGARARALENQFYVVVSQTVGEAEWSEAVDKNTGFAAVYGPSDVGFPEDGIVAQGALNEPGWLYADLDTAKVDYVRENGQVFNFKQSF